jgi:Amt family ammonium transporter
MGALVIGAAAGVGAFLASTRIKRALGYDDSLDVFGVHAVGGTIGALLTGVFAATALGGAGFADGIDGIAAQVGVQFIGVIATVVYTGVVSLIILKGLDLIIGLRITEEQETEGIDLALHDEKGYNW